MIRAIPHRISLPLAFFALVIITGCALLLSRKDDPRLFDAEQRYKNAESAKTVAERKAMFNEALQLYQALEQEYQPRFGTGKLYYNLANTYFQLEEYPWAIFNYLRAQSLMPRNERIGTNLAIAQEKLSLDKENTPGKTSASSPFSNIFFLHSLLSLPERLQIFFFLSIISFLLGSAVIWYPNTWLKRGMWISLVFLGIALASLLYTQYFSPVKAILVKSSDLYRDGGTQYAKIGDTPLPAGMEVEVIDTLPNGQWLKIVSPKGDPGFVPSETLRII